MLGHAGGDHSPSPHVISPELSPHLHHSDYSPSPPGQDRLQPVNGSGPGPTTWENMQQRQQQEQQTRNMEMQRYGNNVSPSEMLENVMIGGGDGSGPNSGEGRRSDQSLPGHHHPMQPQYHQMLPSNRGLPDDTSANSIKHKPPADEMYRGEQRDFDGYQIHRGGTIMDGNGRGLKQYLETRTRYQDGRLGILPPGKLASIKRSVVRISAAQVLIINPPGHLIIQRSTSRLLGHQACRRWVFRDSVAVRLEV